jgi:hypothetical protein
LKAIFPDEKVLQQILSQLSPLAWLPMDGLKFQAWIAIIT